LSQIYIPATGPDDWQRLLANPQRHWRAGFSAHALAHSWHAAANFPPEVQVALEATGNPALQKLETLLMLPEHKVALPGRGASSQTDLWVLARNNAGLVSIAVEGKVDEPFDDPLGKWLDDDSVKLLGLPAEPPHSVRYQLLHRAASALIEARRFHAQTAVLLVHSFSPRSAWHADYQAFSSLFGIAGSSGVIEDAGKREGIQLFLGWIRGDVRFLNL
jgi:hypothetical protein